MCPGSAHCRRQRRAGIWSGHPGLGEGDPTRWRILPKDRPPPSSLRCGRAPVAGTAARSVVESRWFRSSGTIGRLARCAWTPGGRPGELRRAAQHQWPRAMIAGIVWPNAVVPLVWNHRRIDSERTSGRRGGSKSEPAYASTAEPRRSTPPRSRRRGQPPGPRSACSPCRTSRSRPRRAAGCDSGTPRRLASSRR